MIAIIAMKAIIAIKAITAITIRAIMRPLG